MKKILLLTVHPDENSLSHQFANIALDELKNKYDVEKINLYQDKEGDFWYLTFWADKIPTNDPELRAWREGKVKETDKFVVFSLFGSTMLHQSSKAGMRTSLQQNSLIVIQKKDQSHY